MKVVEDAAKALESPEQPFDFIAPSIQCPLEQPWLSAQEVRWRVLGDKVVSTVPPDLPRIGAIAIPTCHRPNE